MPTIQNPAIRETMVKNKVGYSPRPSREPKPPMQVLERRYVGPRSKVDALIWNCTPENVMETGVLKSQGTGQMPISRSISKKTHKHAGPGPRADILGTRDLVIEGLYTLCVTDDLGGASVNDGTVAIDNSHPINRNTVERALPVALHCTIVNIG